MGRANQWYSQTVGSMKGDWETLCSKFCLAFFPISRVVSLQSEVLSFKQKEKESLGMAWHGLILMTSSPLALTLPFKTIYFSNIFTWVLTRIPWISLIWPLEELSFIYLLVWQRLSFTKLLDAFPTLAFMMNLWGREGIISRTRRESFDSQIITIPILRFSYRSRNINTPKSSKGRRNSTFGNPC